MLEVLINHVTCCTAARRAGCSRLARIVSEEDAWIYSPAWPEKLRAAGADVTAGQVRRFDTNNAFLEHVEKLDDEAGG